MAIAYQPSQPPSRFRGDLGARYRAVYGLPETSGVGLREAQLHWGLERALTDELWKSTPENRWKVFSDCYSQLYADLPWLNDSPGIGAAAAAFVQWDKLLPTPSRVFEVGSGRARLLKYLSGKGHTCVATEITPERGARHVRDDGDLEWRVTDGIHLADFEPEGSYDVVISTGVVEHFHPDDLQAHFDHALRILKPGGRYIFTTPHVGAGPHDLSAVFDLDTAECMHLKEYDYAGIDQMLRRSGFAVKAVFPPSRIFTKLRYCRESRTYLAYLKLFDLDSALPPRLRKQLRRLEKLLLVPDNIWLSAKKVGV